MMRLIAIVLLALLAGAGCAVTWSTSPKLPSGATLVREQLTIHSDFLLPRTHRLVEEIVALRSDIAETLATPLSDEPIHVFLFEHPDDYESFIRLRYPDLPDRRAWFVESDTQLAVFAHWGHHVAVDLRHETAHGYLHSTTPNLPLWLDEGLAEYFETPRSRQGLNLGHIEYLSRQYEKGSWTPDLRRLERMRIPEAMTKDDYAESWAWVRYLLDTTPERRSMLRGYLVELRAEGKAPPLSEMLGQSEPHAARRLLRYVEELAAEHRR